LIRPFAITKESKKEIKKIPAQKQLLSETASLPPPENTGGITTSQLPHREQITKRDDSGNSAAGR
jgi:hypothetical protein